MFRAPFSYIRLGKSLLSLLQQLSRQRKFLAKNVTPVLKNARLTNDGSLDIKDFEKITQYYGLAVPAILGEAFCSLRGTDMSERERWASTCQGAMTGLFDDFFDKEFMEDEQVKAKISGKSINSYHKSNEKLFSYFYQEALAQVPSPEKMQQALMAVHHAQVKSKQQTDPSLSWRAIEMITEEKGGTSLLFYRTAFLPSPTDQEVALLFHLGGTMQLANDIFDVYKDRENRVRTLMTETKKVNTVRQILSERLTYAYAAAYTLPHHSSGVRRFLDLVSIGIFSRGFVCLDQMEQNEKTTNGIFEVETYTRKQLICDMDTKKNMLRSAAYHLKTVL